MKEKTTNSTEIATTASRIHLLHKNTIKKIDENITRILNSMFISDDAIPIEITIEGSIKTDEIKKSISKGKIGTVLQDDLYLLVENNICPNKIKITVGTKDNLKLISGERAFENFLSDCKVKNTISIKLNNIDFSRMHSVEKMFLNTRVNKITLIGSAPKVEDTSTLCNSRYLNELDLSGFIAGEKKD